MKLRTRTLILTNHLKRQQNYPRKLPAWVPLRLMMMTKMVNWIFLKIKMMTNQRLQKRLKPLKKSVVCLKSTLMWESLTFTSAEHLLKAWTSSIYTIFHPLPCIETIEGRCVHVFECAALHCKGSTRGVRRFLDTGDSKSTGALHTHTKHCWDEETVKAAIAMKNLKDTWEIVERAPQRDSSLTATFEWIRKETITYSHHQHTYEETRWENSSFLL